MSKFSKSVLKLARENPEFRQALLEEVSAKKADRDGNYMSRQALQQISVQAQELLGMIDPSTELEDWMEAKFIRAAGMLTSAYNAMKYGDSKMASALLSARDVEKLPIGSIVFMVERGRPSLDLTVVPGGLAPVSILSEKADGFVPEGEAARGFGDQFLLAYRGKNNVLSKPAAKKHSMRAFREFGKTASHKHLYGDDLVESLELLARLGPDWTSAQKRAAKEIAKAVAKGDKATVRRHMRALDTTSIYNEISNWVDFS